MPNRKFLSTTLARAAVQAALLCLAFITFTKTGIAAEPTGEQIYRDRCAACHGSNGEGTDTFPSALVGDKTVAMLTEVIGKTMPDGAPEDCVGEDAAKVAAYIHEAFYSPMAQIRNQPPQVEVSRLTVRQYQNAITDLLGSFGGSVTWNDERGLRGEYYRSRSFRRDHRQIERRDATVNYDFGKSSPGEKIPAEEFAMRWQGSVLAPDSGDYEFIVETKNSARLWINDRKQPLIDAWVMSGEQTEYRQTLPLLGGRVYALRLEFAKSKGKSDEVKEASIRLKWKPPHQIEQVIPERLLSPHEVPTQFVLKTPFPPDDRSTGYERGTSISKAWDRATTYAAIEVAGYVATHLADLSGVKSDAPDRKQRLQEFCRQFVERAFRRPLSDAECELFVDRQFAEADDMPTAVKRVVLLTLKSPRFLYREFGFGEFDAYDTAAWLAFGLWDSLPDQTLLDAAAKGELATREQVARQADRMLLDLRTRSKMRAFLHQWLGVDRFHDVSKNPEHFPGFDEALVSDLRVSLDLFLDDVVWNESSDFRELLRADSIYLNDRLAKFYGAKLAGDGTFQEVSFEPDVRAGLLSHPYLMAGFAYHEASSPIHRGVFLSRSLLGRFLKPPPEAVSPLSPDLHPNMTTRQRTELQTGGESCMVCHSMINPLGFSLENFDAVGRYRQEERNQPIDAAGSYHTLAGEVVQFEGARELAAFLADSPEVHSAFVEQLFNYMMKQPLRAFGANQPADLRQTFVEHGFNIRKLLVEAATTSALGVRTMTP